MEKAPSRMLAVLRECGALARVLPELDRSYQRPDVPEHLAHRLDEAASRGFALPVRFALLTLDLPVEDIASLCARVNAPNDCRELARLASCERDEIRTADLDADSTLSLLERSDAFRRPERLERLLEVAECDALPASIAPRKAGLAAALRAARGVDAAPIARENPSDVPGAVRRARLAAIASLQAPTGN
jgi:tRNA nucleotidyltransferase (CCA-adding enzyme)